MVPIVIGYMSQAMHLCHPLHAKAYPCNCNIVVGNTLPPMALSDVPYSYDEDFESDGYDYASHNLLT